MDPYGQYCPVARATEIIADRWTPLIIRELLAGIHRFNDLDRGLPGISRPLLAERLRRLEHADIVERRTLSEGANAGYYLTAAGEELRAVIQSLGEWGAKWAFGDPRPDELDPALLLWRMRRRIDLALVPLRRVVIRFDFRGMKRPRPHWLVIEKPEVSLCLTDPGFDTDLYVGADLAAFYKVWLGRSTWIAATREGLIEVDGPPALTRVLPRWLQWSPFAPTVREAAARGAGS
jgi:DNA-binding HxlR family transcriptional regulator